MACHRHRPGRTRPALAGEIRASVKAAMHTDAEIALTEQRAQAILDRHRL